jgi:hypothetical protein
MTDYNNNAITRCKECFEEIHHEPQGREIDAREHGEECPKNPENWKGRMTIC